MFLCKFLFLLSLVLGYNPEKDLQVVYSQKDYNRFLKVCALFISILIVESN